MAEVVVGAVASAVGIAGFALQLTETVVKLKEFCSKVQNAPSELQECLEYMDYTTRILDRIAAPQSSAGLDHTLLQESVKQCRRAQGRITSITDDLQAAMRSRKLRTSLKLVLKEAEMSCLLRRLDQARADLHHAHLAYTTAQMRSDQQRSFADMEAKHAQLLQQHTATLFEEIQATRASLEQQMQTAQAIVVQRVDAGQLQLIQQVQGQATAQMSACAVTPRVDTGDQCLHTNAGSRRSKTAMEHAVWSKKYHLRLFSQVWDVSVTQALSGWTFSMRPYRIVPFDHPVFYLCYHPVGTVDINAIKQALDRREVSIYDRDIYGCSLFTASALTL
ncbi:hypothetical protein LTR36_003339 [Oleoguttula mirabilis]|uniref:Fungal N-terminal domain-containing protein n=1 Tax=Oleoguttula mirabilis TaxID=1507867 RepID=A0AAV9JXB2_9PEZI|nr:hypothetical protein LTR36_003339 [Oleoguttula mirabilis]